MNLGFLKNTWGNWSTKKKIIVIALALIIIGALSDKDDGDSQSSKSQPASHTLPSSPTVNQLAPQTQNNTAASQPSPQPAKAEPAKQWVASDGLTESQWISRCQRYETAKQACAVANRPSQCMEMKLGDVDNQMGGLYCDNGKPNWSLMGRR